MKMTGVAKGVYPINTGKVSIGAMYIPKKPHYCTEAELWTQKLLLSKPSKRITLMRKLVNIFKRG